MIRKRLLIFSRYYWPAYRSGGPVRSLQSLCRHFADEYDLYIVCYNHDKGDARPFADLPSGQWQQIDGAQLYYTPHEQTSLSQWRKLVAEIAPDMLYLQSLYDPHFTQKPLLLRSIGAIGKIPILLAPRGELFDGAINTSPLKKRLYIALFRWIFARKWLHFQVSSQAEATTCARYFPASQSRIHLATDMQVFDSPSAKNAPIKKEGTLRLIYLARLAANKNLLHAIKAVAGLKGAITLDIYGPKENADYVKTCQTAARTVADNIQIRFLDALPHEKVASTLSAYDAYILPSFAENYGHGIVEAMACGLPIFISDQTPFAPQKHQAGYALSLDDMPSWQTALQAYVNMDAASYQALRQYARDYAQIALDQTSQITDHHAMFNAVLNVTAQA
jgi:glycosyltransferase involved in cell wall biosynthesis